MSDKRDNVPQQSAPLEASGRSVDRFESWLESPLGQRLLERQHEQLESVARRFHGESMLWCGPLTDTRHCTDRSMVRLRIFAPDGDGAQCAQTPHGSNSSGGELGAGNVESGDDHAWLRADVHALPLRSRSLSAVVLHHTLDRVDEPRHALREVVRVLEHGGILVVCGFNPYSLWSLRRAYASVRPDAFSHLNFVAPNRLHDWLTVLGMDSPRLAPTLLKRPTLAAAMFDSDRLAALRKRLSRLPIGGCYIMTAVKEAGAGRLRWREELSRRLTSGVTAPNPVVRQLQPSTGVSSPRSVDERAPGSEHDDER